MPFGSVLKLERRVSHEGMVSVGGNLYSVPDATRKRLVEVHTLADEIRIFEDGALIATHPMLEGRGRRLVAPGHRKFRVVVANATITADATPIPARAGGVSPPVTRRLRGRRPPSRRQGRAGMTAAPEIVPAILDRIRRTLVGLKYPRAGSPRSDGPPARTRRSLAAGRHRYPARRGTDRARAGASRRRW